MNKKELFDQVSSLVKEHLPEIVGKELKLVLEKAEKDAISVEELNGKISEKEQEVKRFRSLAETKSALEKREQQVKKLEEELTKKENARKTWEAETKLLEAEKRINDVVNLVTLVFKSPLLRKVTSESLGYFTTYNQRGDPISVPSSKSVTEEQTNV